MKGITVKFKRDHDNVKEYTSKDYHYATSDDTVEIGDHVVVDSPINGPVVVMVVGFCSLSSCNKPIICKVDRSGYETDMVCLHRITKLKRELEARRKRFEEHALWEMMAKSDPEAKVMLDELKSMGV